MASEQEHISKANRNGDFLDQQLAAAISYDDWIAVAAFYKAVQIAEAIFAKLQPFDTAHSVSHKKRNAILKRDYPRIWRPYYQLFRASLVARYLEVGHPGAAFPTFANFISHHDLVEVLLGVELIMVETEAAPLLSAGHGLKGYEPMLLPPNTTFARGPA